MTRLLCLLVIVLLCPVVRAADFNIAEYGATPDGTTLSTVAIQKAIDTAASSDGGDVVIPAGKFLSGAIFLKPHVNLRIEKDAVLMGSTKIDDYPSMPTRIEGHTQVWRPALINAEKCDGLKISGEGTIQGGGKVYWDAFNNARKANRGVKNLDVDRPRNMFIRDSRDVTISGVSLRESGFWNIHLYRCPGATIDHVDIRTPPGAPSTDGMDIDSCQDVTIRGCYIAVDDDDIALKGSKGPLADKDEDSPAVERIHIVDCTFAHGHGCVTLGSEACRVKGVLVENCKVEDAPDPAGGPPHRNVLVRLKLRPDTPQHYEDLRFNNIEVNFAGNLFSIEPWTQYFDLKGEAPPTQTVENVTVENITGSAGGFGKMSPPDKATVRSITLKNIDVKLKDEKMTIQNIEGLTAENVKINGAVFTAPK